MTDDIRILVTAKYIMPMPGQILEKHYVVIEGDRVVGIERFHAVDTTSVVEFYDLGDAVIMPGFINSHARLETCHLQGRVPYTGSFTGWLQTLVSSRNSASDAEVEAGIHKGLQQAVQGGTTAIGDVAFSDKTFAPIMEFGLRGVVYFEAYGFDPELADTEFLRVQRQLEAAVEFEMSGGAKEADAEYRPLVQFGVGANAPYAVSENLYCKTLRLMLERGDRFCTQLAETEEERKLLQVFSGEFVPFLENIFPEGVPGLRAAASPVAYMAELIKLCQPKATKNQTGVFRQPQQPVFVHCHYLDEDDWQIIHDLRAAVVFCPRHHAFFDHAPHPLMQLLDREITVALGTSSLASNDSMSMLDEVRFLGRSTTYKMPPNEVLRMATTYGARALGIEDEVGLLAPGMKADLIGISIPRDTEENQVADAIVSGMGPVLFTMVAGNPIFQEN